MTFAAATPPLDFQPGILLGLVGFAFAVRMDECPRPRRGAWHGFLFGLSANLVALRFVPELMVRFTPLPAFAGWIALVLLSAMQALPWTIAGAVTTWLSFRPDGSRRAPWLFFALSVYVATLLPAVFPWTPAGGLAPWPILLQTAELVGERGTSFFVAIACGLIAEGIARSRAPRTALRYGTVGVAVLGGLTLYGALRMRAIDAARERSPRARVGLLQTDEDATFRWEEKHATAMLDRLTAMTKRSEQEGALLTVWPESAYPYTLEHGTTRSPRGPRALFQKGVRGPLLTGAYLSIGDGLGTNSALLVLPDGEIAASYDKRHLLWFGETIPLADVFPFLRRVFARGTGIAPGTDNVAFRTGPFVAAVLECYEDTLPFAGREAMSVHPNILVNITNDAWFAGSAEGELHLRLSVLRAIESRRDLVRAVNRGPAAWIDGAGRLRGRHPPTPELGPSPPLMADVALLDAPVTLYTRAGDLPLLFAVLVGTALLVTKRNAGATPV